MLIPMKGESERMKVPHKAPESVEYQLSTIEAAKEVMETAESWKLTVNGEITFISFVEDGEEQEIRVEKRGRNR